MKRKKKLEKDFEIEGKYHFFPQNKKEEKENEIYLKKYRERYYSK